MPSATRPERAKVELRMTPTSLWSMAFALTAPAMRQRSIASAMPKTVAKAQNYRGHEGQQQMCWQQLPAGAEQQHPSGSEQGSDGESIKRTPRMRYARPVTRWRTPPARCSPTVLTHHHALAAASSQSSASVDAADENLRVNSLCPRPRKMDSASAALHTGTFGVSA